MTDTELALGDTVRTRAIAYIRTGVPALIGALLTWLASRIPAVFEFLEAVDTEWRTLLYSLITALVILAYYALARWLGGRWPKIETLMLGSSKTPVYAGTISAKHSA